MVVGLAAVVVQLEQHPADLEAHLVAIGGVGVAVARRPHQVGCLELALVDDAVVAGGEHVAVETRGEGLVAHHGRCGPVVRAGVLLERTDAEDVVDVAV